MKNTTKLLAIAALATTVATGAMAGEKSTTIQPLPVHKSTQAGVPSWGLGGLGAGAGMGAIIAGIVVVGVVVAASTSGT